ncbi:MAG: hypothetical protein NVS9B1_22130 [Candidatus Dormibacteraceae bacterium]
MARLLAARAGLGAHLDIDVIYELVVGGIEFRRDSPAEDFWQLKLARHHVRLLAASFAAGGILPVVDDVIADREVFAEYAEGLPKPVRLVVLAPSLEVVLARDAGRGEGKQAAAAWAHLADPMVRDLGAQGLWVDSSELDADATVALVERRWDEALLTITA